MEKKQLIKGYINRKEVAEAFQACFSNLELSIKQMSNLDTMLSNYKFAIGTLTLNTTRGVTKEDINEEYCGKLSDYLRTEKLLKENLELSTIVDICSDLSNDEGMIDQSQLINALAIYF